MEDTKAPIIHEYACKNIKLLFQIVDAAKINPKNKAYMPFKCHPPE